MPIAYEKEFELYHYGESICSQMARLALLEKQIPYKSHHVNLESTGEHLSKTFRKINPQALVPVLIHNGKPIYNSWEIIKYVDAHAPTQGVKLWPDADTAQQQIAALIEDNALDERIAIGDNFGSSIAGASTYILAQILKTRPLWAVLYDYATKHPDKKRMVLFILLRLFGRLPPFLYRKFIKRLALGLVSMERQLAHGGDYLLGDYSAADVMVAAHFHRLEDIALGHILQSDRFPNLKAYWARLQARAAYQKAIIEEEKPDWRNAINIVYGSKPNPFSNLLHAEIDKIINNEK